VSEHEYGKTGQQGQGGPGAEMEQQGSGYGPNPSGADQGQPGGAQAAGGGHPAMYPGQGGGPAAVGYGQAGMSQGQAGGAQGAGPVPQVPPGGPAAAPTGYPPVHPRAPAGPYGQYPAAYPAPPPYTGPQYAPPLPGMIPSHGPYAAAQPPAAGMAAAGYGGHYPPPMGLPPQYPPPQAAHAAGGQPGAGAHAGKGMQGHMSDLVDDISNGGSGLSSLGKMLNLDDSEFWKGALIGAAAVLLLTNEKVQDTLFKTGAKAKEAVKSGVEKIKETSKDSQDASAGES
jgi:hypothetical protein